MKLALSFIAAVLVGSLNGQTLWQSTTYGMPISELVKQEPKLREMTKDEVEAFYPKDLRVAADKELIGAIELFGHPFFARFSLTRDKLERVALFVNGEEFPRGKAKALRDDALNALREKYGASTSFRTDTTISDRNPALIVTWRSGKTTICAHSLIIDNHLWLTITYTVEREREASKL